MAYLNRTAADAAMQRPGQGRWTQEELAKAVGISHVQLGRIFAGQSTKTETIGWIEEALGVRRGSLLRPASALDTILGDEWNINNLKKVGTEVTAANGLRFQVHEVASRVHATRFGRLKRYDIQQLSLRTQKRIEAVLLRHARASLKLQHLPCVARHITSGSDNAAFCHWVLDERPSGVTLDALAGKSLPYDALVEVMGRLAEGIATLHENDVILREIRPDSVMVDHSNSGVVLLDFELVKLMENIPTVSPDKKWRTSSYIATEVAAGAPPTPAADWYAWGMLFLYGLNRGRAPEPEQAEAVIGSSDLPDGISDVVLRCLSKLPSKRPKAKAILRALKKG